MAFDNERRFQQWQAAYGGAAAAGQPQGAQADALREEAQQLLQGLLDVLSGGGLESALMRQQARFTMLRRNAVSAVLLLPTCFNQADRLTA